MNRVRNVGVVLVLGMGLPACGAGSDPAEPDSNDEAGGSYIETLGKTYHGGFADRTRGDMQAIANASAARMVDAGSFSAATDISGLAADLEPHYIRSLPRTDAWGNPFHYRSDGSGFTLTSSGRNGALGDSDDIVMTDGGFR